MRLPRVRPTALLLVFLLSILVAQARQGHLFGLLEETPVKIDERGMAVVANPFPDNTTQVADLGLGNSTVMNRLVGGHWMSYYEVSTTSANGSWHSLNFLTIDGSGATLVNATVQFLAGPDVLTVYLDLGSWNITSPISTTERWN